VFPLAIAEYYPLLVELSDKANDSDSDSGSDSYKERDDRSEYGR
jgi:hypothetical protein